MQRKTAKRERLEDAIAKEKRALLRVRQTYEELTAKMNAYQLGRGPAPSNEDFAQWSEAVEQHIRLKKLGIRVDGEGSI